MKPDELGNLIVTPTATAEQAKRLSRSMAKRLMNLHRAEIQERTDTTKHQAQVLADGVNDLRAQLATAEAKLKSATVMMFAMVRRYGPQTFERDALSEAARTAALLFDVSPERIVVRAGAAPCEAVGGKAE